MSNPGKGGRGKDAPYSTTHCRIPEPLKATVERLTSAYRILVGSEDPEACKRFIDSVDNAITNLGESQQNIKNLEADLIAAKNEIKALKVKVTSVIITLETVLQLKAKEGTKMKGIIRESIENLKQYLIPGIY